MKSKLNNILIISVLSVSSCAYTNLAIANDKLPQLFDGSYIKGSTLTGSSNPLFLVDFSEKDTIASVTLGEWRPLRFNNALSLGMEFKSSIDKNTGSADLIDFDGLNNGTYGSLLLHYRKVEKLSNTDSYLESQQRKLCSEYLRKPDWNKTCDAAEIEKNEKKYLETLDEESQKNLCLSTTDIQEVDCNPENMAKYRRKLYSYARRNIHLDYPVVAYIGSVKAEYGKKNFEYIENTTFESKESDKEVYSLSGSFGQTYKNGFYGGGVQYLKSYKGKNEKTLCKSLAQNSDTQECKTGSIGEPSSLERQNLFLEARVKPFSKPIAISPKLTYDIKNEVFGASLPIYFIADRKNNLIGGLRFDWNEANNDVLGAIFVGKSFNFFE